jgi:hypothetical protein
MDRNGRSAEVPLSKPSTIVALRMTEQEREALARLAHEQHVTMSSLIREGLRLFAEDADAELLRALADGDSRCQMVA